MRPQDIKYHNCPLCHRQATVLVDIKDDTSFYPDDEGNIQYRCTNCHTTFSIDIDGKVIVIKLGF